MSEQHRIVVERDSDGEPTSVRFICAADKTADCHQYPACDCEYWSDEHNARHPKVAHDECWIEPWLGWSDAPLDWEDNYDGDEPFELHSAPIRTSWEGDYVTWDYDPSPIPHITTVETRGGLL